MTFTNNTHTPTVGISSGLDNADVTINGAPVEIAAFDAGNSITDKEFTIASGKTWTFNNGLTIANDVTLNKEGTLNIGVSTADQLMAAIQAGANTVKLKEGEYALSSQLTINKVITLEGTFTESDSTRIIRTSNWSETSNSSKHMISVQANDVELKNIIVDAKGFSSGAAVEGSGIQVYNATDVKLTNVIARNTKAAGVIVNSSTVTAENLHTEGNTWGGVNTDQKTTGIPSFTFDEESEFDEPWQVWSEATNGISVVRAPEGWRTYSTTNEKGTLFNVWTDNKLISMVLPKSILDSNNEGEVSVFANGYPVTVSEQNNELIIATEDGETLTFSEKAEDQDYYPVRLYGGSYESTVASSSITLISGKIRNVYGGGRSDKVGTQADVTGTATINVTGTASVNVIVGGGRYYAKTGAVDINVGSETAPYAGKMGTIYVGAMDQGQTSNKDKPYNNTIDENVNGIPTVTLDIYGGNFEEVACGGGNGYVHTGTSTVNIHNATIDYLYGASANGTADNVTVHVYNTEVKKELAAVQRSHIGVLNMTFDKNCTFSENIETSLAATIGWASSDTNGSIIPCVNASATYTFEGSNVPVMKVGPGMNAANITLTGALAKVTKFDNGINNDPTKMVAGFQQYTTAFTIDADKTWTFNNGLIFATDANAATLTNNGTLIVKGVTDADNLKALVTSEANEITTTLQASAVPDAFSGMAELPTNMVIYATDKAVYMTKDEADVAAAMSGKTAAYLVKQNDNTYTLSEDVSAPTTPPVITDEHKPSIVGDPEAGKTLSAYALKGGIATVNDAEIAGSFTWVNPDATLNAGEHEYEVVFTPVDLSLYSTVKTSIKINAIQYYTVTAGTCENGKVIIENASTANKYTAGTTLTLRAEADPHYKFKQWGEGITGTTYNVTADKELTATFEAITHEVTVPSSVEGGTLSVSNNGAAISSPVPEGTIVTVVATPAAGKELDALTYQIGNTIYPIRNGQVEVSAAMTISATFKDKVNHLLQLAAGVANGKILLFDADGNAINMGTAVTTGTKLTVVAVPDKGYTASNIIGNGATLSGSYHEVGNSDVTFSATFAQATYAITTDAGANVSLNKVRGSGTSTSSCHYGDVYTATATASTNHRLISLLVNGKEMANEGQFTVTGNMTITVNEVALTTIQIDEAQQTYVYDGEAKKFAIRSTPMGLTGFTVTYEKDATSSTEAPTEAGTYKVTIARAADDSFAAFNQTIEAGLVIDQAELKGVGAPTWNGTAWTGSSLGTWTEESGQTGNIVKVTFRPHNANFKSVVFEGIKDPSGLTTVQMPTSGLRSSTLRAETTASLSINATNGAVSLWNGTEKITSNSRVYVGQTLTVKGLPNAGYSSNATWTINNGTETTDTGTSTTITLGSTENNIIVNFPAKTSIETLPRVSNTTTAYSGSVILPSITTGTISNGWTYVIKAGGVVVDHPTDADTYSVYASRSEDEQYMAVDNQFIGSYTISQQTITTGVSVTSASPILKGQTLAQSTLTGTAPVAGTFAWASPTTVPADESTDYAVIFTPNDTKNYEVASSVSLKQKVSFYTGSRKATARVITFAPAENGTFVVKVNGVAVEMGAQVSAGDQVVVDTTPNSGYSASVSYTGITNGVVDATGKVSVTVTFTRNSTPVTPGEGGGGSDPDPVIPTVSNPVVAERTATTAAVTWEKVSGATSYKLFLYAKKTDSTPLKIYEFDKDGKLKATAISFTLTGLEEGKAYYVETAAYNASGTLLVKKSVELSATPTGIEAISEGSQLYTVKGAVVVAPTEPLQVAIYSVTGQTLFNDEVSYLTQVPAQAGIYVVVIQKGKDRITEKVIVK